MQKTQHYQGFSQYPNPKGLRRQYIQTAHEDGQIVLGDRHPVKGFSVFLQKKFPTPSTAYVKGREY